MATTLQQRGMSLVELMISVTIGLIITLAISTLFLNTNRSNKENNETALMQENARFALESIATDLRHGGFFGNVPDPSLVTLNGVTMPGTGTPPSTDCGSTSAGASYMLNFTTPAQLIGYGTDLTNTTLPALIAPCTLPTGVAVAASQNTILAIKRVASSSKILGTDATTDGSFKKCNADTTSGGCKEKSIDGRLFVHSNGSTAMLGSGNAMPVNFPTTQVWEYMPRYYYITNTHTLYRSTFSIETPGQWLDEPLAEGIERFHIEFGVDSDSDGTPNYFSDVQADINFNLVVSARIHVLARTTTVDRNYTDDNRYVLGSLTVTPASDAYYSTLPNRTNYHRQVYSTTVTIPNLRRRQTTN